jgi:hypothetical protein
LTVTAAAVAVEVPYLPDEAVAVVATELALVQGTTLRLTLEAVVVELVLTTLPVALLAVTVARVSALSSGRNKLCLSTLSSRTVR